MSTEAVSTNKEDPMTTQAQAGSQHLAAARELLDDLRPLTEGAGDPQTKATAAAAHAILVLAEQVAVARVLMASDAASRSTNGQAAQ
jgi:hypothetical protein